MHRRIINAFFPIFFIEPVTTLPKNPSRHNLFQKTP